MSSNEIYMDRRTGVWGAADDIVVFVPSTDQLSFLEEGNDAEILRIANEEWSA